MYLDANTINSFFVQKYINDVMAIADRLENRIEMVNSHLNGLSRKNIADPSFNPCLALPLLVAIDITFDR